MILRWVVLFILVCATFTSVVSAQTREPAGKRAAIRELLSLSGATQSAKTIFVSLIDQYSQALARDSISSFESKAWPPAFKAKAQQLTQDFYGRLSLRLREEVPQRIQYEEKVGAIYLEAYDRYFTEDEIRELLAFYKSPIGRKFLGLAPHVAATMQSGATSDFEVQVRTVTREIVAEEIKGLESRAEAELRTLTPKRRVNR